VVELGQGLQDGDQLSVYTAGDVLGLSALRLADRARLLHRGPAPRSVAPGDPQKTTWACTGRAVGRVVVLRAPLAQVRLRLLQLMIFMSCRSELLRWSIWHLLPFLSNSKSGESECTWHKLAPSSNCTSTTRCHAIHVSHLVRCHLTCSCFC
jgi:hypothetical protein